MHSHLSPTRSLLFGAFALVPGLLMGASALAKDATPSSTPGGPSEGYPVAIHAGSCDNLTEQPEYEIDNAVSFGVKDSGDVQTIGNSQGAPVVLSAAATVDSKLDDLAKNGNAIAVHAGADNYGTIIACGNIVGIKDDGKLIVPLNSSKDSTVVGIAILDEDTSGVLGLGSDQVKATVYLFDTTDQAAATPAS